MYEFARGPLVWVAFIALFGGLIVRFIWLLFAARREGVIYPYMRLKFGLRSLLHWVIPFGSRNMRLRPVFTVFSFLFHICLLVTPILAMGHIVLWNESWSISWWSLPEGLTQVMTFIVVISGILFVLRRLADPTVRLVTDWTDYLLLVIVIAPFITGLLAYYQIGGYRTIITIHMWSGAIWMAAIPFTRLVHMLFFPFTRAYMGCEFGFVRNSRDW